MLVEMVQQKIWLRLVDACASVEMGCGKRGHIRNDTKQISQNPPAVP